MNKNCYICVIVLLAVFCALIAPASLLAQTTKTISGTVTDANAPVALLAARNAIAKPYEITDMSNY